MSGREALEKELEKDMSRLWKRNLGRSVSRLAADDHRIPYIIYRLIVTLSLSISVSLSL